MRKIGTKSLGARAPERHRLAPPIKADPLREAVSELSGPGALDLVVELVHDLRSPLTSILFLSETLMTGQSGDVNDLQHRQLGLVYDAALGLNAMMSDVIELAEGGSRLVDGERAPFSIKAVFEAVEDMVRPIADEKGLEVRTLSPHEDWRLGHRSALNRVLLNLTINAIKSTDYGYVEIEAEPSAKLGVAFSVRDTGQGIPPAALDTLLHPFRPSRTRNESLLCQRGLGLNICQKLLGAMGSELEVETRPGWGTRFHFQLDFPLSSVGPLSQGPERA